MSEGTNPLDLAGIVGGFVTFLGTVGGGVKWLFGRVERREKALDAKEEATVAKLEERVAALEKDNRKIWLALSYVVPALHAQDPKNPALKVVAQILGDAFPVPQDMTDTLGKIA